MPQSQDVTAQAVLPLAKAHVQDVVVHAKEPARALVVVVALELVEVVALATNVIMVACSKMKHATI